MPPPPPTRHAIQSLRRILAWLLKTASLFLTLLALLLFAMWFEHRSNIALPQPSGPFPVGRTTYTWTNAAETDDLAPSPNSKRQVVVWIWYPAAPTQQDLPADYLPAPWRAALDVRLGFLMRTFLKRDGAKVHAHSLANPPVSPARQTYPVVLLRAGGSALTTDFTTLAEDLASHGFIVVGFDAPYRSFVVVLPDGRVAVRSPTANVENANGDLDDPLIGKLLALWISDTAFVVDQLQHISAGTSEKFSGRMDLTRLGMFGHSFGGAAALQFCHLDSRCKAALDIDGIPFGSVVSQGLGKPGMFLLSDHSREKSGPESRRVLAEIREIYDRLPEDRLWVVLHRANHFSFSDQILLNSRIVFAVLRLIGVGGLDGRRGLAISADYVQAFFNVHLNGAPETSLTSLAKKYPEALVQH